MGLGNEAHTVGERESACKPGSVESNHSSGTRVAASLERPTRKRARIALRRPVLRGPRCFPIWPCSRWGLPCRRVLPPARCALTAPFHPYRSLARRRRFAFCCTVRGLAPPRRYLAPHPPEPGLSSTLANARAAIARPTPGAELSSLEKIASDFFDTAPSFAAAKSAVFVCAST